MCFFNGIWRSHVDFFIESECNLMWIFFTSQSTLILNPKIMLNLEIVCNTLNRIFGVVGVTFLQSPENVSPEITYFIHT
jgi:hypothetical protein